MTDAARRMPAGPVMERAARVRELFADLIRSGGEAEQRLWQEAPKLREFFALHAGQEQFVAEFDQDLKLWVNLADHIESQIYFQGMQEGDRGLVRLLKNNCGTGQVFLDVGANVGVYSLIAAKRVAPRGQVLAFEPVQRLYERLQANAALNPKLTIFAERVALSESRGEAAIHVPRHRNLGMSTLHAPGDDSDVETVMTDTLDARLRACAPSRVDWIKLDVEGHELAVLRGAKDVLDMHRPLVACELSREHLGRAGTSPEAIVEFFTALDYRRFRICDDGGLDADSVMTAHENDLFVPAEPELARLRVPKA